MSTQDCHHLGHQLQMWGIPQTTLSFDNSLEGLSMHSKLLHPQLWDLTGIKISQGKRCMHRAESRMGPNTELLVVLFIWSHGQC